MYNVDTKIRVFMYDINTQTTKAFANMEDLLYFIIRNGNYDNFKRNIYLDNINMNFNDLIANINYFKPYDNVVYNLREFLFYDEYLRIIDLRDYTKLIFNKDFQNYLDNKHKYTYKYNHRMKGYKGKNYKYLRKTSISLVNDYRKYLSDIENQQYERKKRISLYKKALYDDEYIKLRDIDYSWKSQRKTRHQWLKSK